MTTYRSTHIPLRPKPWPILVGFIIAILTFGVAFLFALPGMYVITYVALAVGAAQLWRCLQWGAAHGDVEGAFR